MLHELGARPCGASVNCCSSPCRPNLIIGQNPPPKGKACHLSLRTKKLGWESNHHLELSGSSSGSSSGSMLWKALHQQLKVHSGNATHHLCTTHQPQLINRAPPTPQKCCYISAQRQKSGHIQEIELVFTSQERPFQWTLTVCWRPRLTWSFSLSDTALRLVAPLVAFAGSDGFCRPLASVKDKTAHSYGELTICQPPC